MSTMIKLHSARDLTEADLKCFFDHDRECREPRRPGSFFDSEIMERMIASRGDGKDPRPCGHRAAIEEGDHFVLGEDSWKPHDDVAALFKYGQTRTLTIELRHEILEVLGAVPDYDDELIAWLNARVGEQIFCIPW